MKGCVIFAGIVIVAFLAGGLLLSLSGCAALGSAMNAVRVVTSWQGKTPAAVKASWGAPELDVSGDELKAHLEYCPRRTDHYGPVNITKADDRVVELLVYKPTPGSTLASADGKRHFTTSTDPHCDTVIVFGVYASGNIENPQMHVSSGWSSR